MERRADALSRPLKNRLMCPFRPVKPRQFAKTVTHWHTHKHRKEGVPLQFVRCLQGESAVGLSLSERASAVFIGISCWSHREYSAVD